MLQKAITLCPRQQRWIKLRFSNQKNTRTHAFEVLAASHTRYLPAGSQRQYRKSSTIHIRSGCMSPEHRLQKIRGRMNPLPVSHALRADVWLQAALALGHTR
jgi:hypothetical protein